MSTENDSGGLVDRRSNRQLDEDKRLDTPGQLRDKLAAAKKVRLRREADARRREKLRIAKQREGQTTDSNN